MTDKGMLARVVELRDSYESLGMSAKLVNDGKPRINTSNAFTEYLVNASQLTGPLKIEASGKKLVVSMQGTTPGACVDVDFDSGGKLSRVGAGASFTGQFGSFTLNNPSTQAAGVVFRFVIVKQDDADYCEQERGGSGNLQVSQIAQVVNSLVNFPTLVTQGLDVTRCKGVRVALSADAGQTITGGTIVFWAYDNTLARWCEVSSMSDAINPLGGTARRDYMSAEFPIFIGWGRIFVEARSVTVSAGALTQTMTVG